MQHQCLETSTHMSTPLRTDESLLVEASNVSGKRDIPSVILSRFVCLLVSLIRNGRQYCIRGVCQFAGCKRLSKMNALSGISRFPMYCLSRNTGRGSMHENCEVGSGADQFRISGWLNTQERGGIVEQAPA